MDPKRKKIYIIIIVVCVLLAAGVLLWGQGGSIPSIQLTPTSHPSTPTTPSASTTSAPVINPDATYPAPPVFPADQSLDLSVLKSINSLQDFQTIQLLAGELGRDNPLKKY